MWSGPLGWPAVSLPSVGGQATTSWSWPGRYNAGYGGDIVVWTDPATGWVWRNHIFPYKGVNDFLVMNQSVVGELLIVAGGGAGGYRATRTGYGGGGGGLYYGPYAFTPGVHALYVGQGGQTNTSSPGANGQDTVFDIGTPGVLTAFGGGGGGTSASGAIAGNSGGSGGGSTGGNGAATKGTGGNAAYWFGAPGQTTVGGGASGVNQAGRTLNLYGTSIEFARGGNTASPTPVQGVNGGGGGGGGAGGAGFGGPGTVIARYRIG